MSKSKITIPNQYGESIFKVYTKPVSLQASRTKKDILTEEIRKLTRPVLNLLTGDVSIEVHWFINEYERYELDESADIDNILKPILDALSGPEGILIDDCQVQHIVSTWRDRYDEPEHIEISIKYLTDEWQEKKNIMFVQLENSLCMPITNDLDPEMLKLFLDQFELQLHTRNKFLERGGSYYQAKTVMSIQRLFHKSKVGEFEIKRIEELRKNMENT